MSGEEPCVVYVVDDEETVRDGLDSLLRSVGYRVRCFASVDDFLACSRSPRPSCLLLDIQMPGRSGLDLQARLRQEGDDIPIIFLTGHGDVPLSVRAMRAGALDFQLKPFQQDALLESVQAGIDLDRQLMLASAEAADVRTLFEALSPRETEVILLVADGLSSKEIAARLSLKEITIKVHRAAGMRKLQCKGVVELVTKLRKCPP